MRFHSAAIVLGILLLGFVSVQANEISRRLSLTAAEKKWIRENPVIRVGFDEGYPPANFWTNTGALGGLDNDFLSAISAHTGVTFEYVQLSSWEDTILALQAGEIDMVTCITRSREREEYLAFTQVYYDFPIAIIARSDAEFFSTPSSIHGKKIAIPRGYVTHHVMADIGWEVEVEWVPSIRDAYFAVSTGQCYATVANLGNASYLIPRLGITNLKISGVMPEFTSGRIGVRKDLAPLAAIIDKYFDSLTEVERSAIMERWVRLDVPETTNWQLFWRLGIAVAVLAALFGGAMIWRNYSLRRQLAEREEYQNALEEAHERVSRLSEEKSDLLHMVAHDIRGPLMTFQTGVALVLEQLSAGRASDTLKVLNRMDRQTEAMHSLVNSLLDVEAIENGSRVMSIRRIDLRGMVEQVMDRFRENAQRKDITVEWAAPVGELEVMADELALCQVLENLVSNALKYCPIGGRVALRVNRDGDSTQFQIQDNGPGIGADEQARLFTKFAHLSARPTDGESSHGLGLYIVAGLVKSMRGQVRCESRLGQGATFILALPSA